MPMYEGEDACKQCEGWGKIDDGDEGVSWGIWAGLPPGADLAVRLGVVNPITCPRCEGSGIDPILTAKTIDGYAHAIRPTAGIMTELVKATGRSKTAP